ncbi:MAG: YtxH domain-containing protein [Acidobacteriales bacterium]|nr:YtxH domain-containing protein [Terriglobales bacterium]
MRVKQVVSTAATVLIAGAAGAGIALLLAPQSGARTRRLIRRKAEDVAGEIRDIYDSVKEAGGDARRTVYRLRTRLTELKPVGRESS